MAAFELSIALGAFVKPSKVSLRALEWLKKGGATAEKGLVQ